MNFLDAYDKGDVLIKGQLLGYSGTQRGPPMSTAPA
jgi:polar amino acid transport system ATP-binding protein